jgi:hypothetical protein
LGGDSVRRFYGGRVPRDHHVLLGAEDGVRLEDVLDPIGKRAAAQVLEDGAVVIQLDEFERFGLVGGMVHDLADDQGCSRLRHPQNRCAHRSQHDVVVPPELSGSHLILLR